MNESHQVFSVPVHTDPQYPTLYLPFRSKRRDAETAVTLLLFLNTADVGNLQSAVVVISDHGVTHANGDLPTGPVRARSTFN